MFVAIIPAKPLTIYFVMLKWAGFLLSMPNNLLNIENQSSKTKRNGI